VPSQVINREEAGGPTPAGTNANAEGVADEAAREDLAAGLDEIVREGTRRMLAAALEDEAAPTSRRMPPSRARTAGGW
jgi:hypothetical protein